MVLKKIKNPKIKEFTVFRTGWLVQSRVGETFKIEEQLPDKSKEYLLMAMVKSYEFLQFKDIGRAGKDEIKRYNRNFQPWTIFQKISFVKIKEVLKAGGLRKFL